MNTYSQTLNKVKKTKSGSDEISQGQYREYTDVYQYTNHRCSTVFGALISRYQENESWFMHTVNQRKLAMA